MTQKRDLKRRVRERQERTGESYMEALRQVLAQGPAPSKVPVVEALDLTPTAEAIGLTCRVSMLRDLADRIDPKAALVRLREALLATASDPATALLREVVLQGGHAPSPIAPGSLEGHHRFMARVRSGIGGTSDSGRTLAMAIDGRQGLEMVLFVLWPLPELFAHLRRPTLIVTTVDALELDVLPSRGMVALRTP